ncbi:MAG: undecaprenyl-diphosphate phosphatase [Candidatus Pacearchaeota archaeon]
MIKEVILSIIQGITEFLPISSSGHLAIFSNIFYNINLEVFSFLHLASLFAVIFFTRREILYLLRFDKKAKEIFFFLIVATIPAALFGYFLNEIIEKTFSSLLFIGISYLINGTIILLTKFTRQNRGISLDKAIIIGIAQIFSLFPGISRSGITISTAKFLGIKNENAFNFSFLLFIPLSIGSFIIELKNPQALFSFKYLIIFIICAIVSFFSLKLLKRTIKKNNFWVFSFYCFILGILCLILYFF